LCLSIKLAGSTEIFILAAKGSYPEIIATNIQEFHYQNITYFYTVIADASKEDKT